MSVEVLQHRALAGAADEIGFNRYTVLNLHGLLANNLLADPSAAGRLRIEGPIDQFTTGGKAGGKAGGTICGGTTCGGAS